MKNKDILELKKRFKKEACTFTKVTGCYVNSEKKILLEFKETFLNLPDDDMFKYLEITKKALSGKIGNNLLELKYPLNTYQNNEKQQLLMMLVKSGLKEDSVNSLFFESIVESYDNSGNYLILLFHDAYDVMTKTSDNRKLDESEEVYEYIIGAICPVSLSKPGLGYFDDENKIKSRIRDWIVEAPVLGFTYPGFIERSADVDTIMYYTKDPKSPHAELMENALGCPPKETATNQLEAFENLIKTSVNGDEEMTEKVFAKVQNNLSDMLEEHKEIYEDMDVEPVVLSKEKVKNLLIESDLSEEVTAQIEKAYDEKFGDEPPLAEYLLDSKLIKKNAQKKREEELVTQIVELESKLEKAEKEALAPKVDEDSSDDEGLNHDANGEDEHAEITGMDDNEMMGLEDPAIQENADYDVVVHVKPEKIPTIKTELINGQRCIVIPIGDDEHANINGVDGLI